MKLHASVREFCDENSKPIIKNKWRNHSVKKYCGNRFWFVLFSSIALFFISLCFNRLFFFGSLDGFIQISTVDNSKHFPIDLTTNSITDDSKNKDSDSFAYKTRSRKIKNKNKDSCSRRYVYVHNLPKRFNEDVLKNCQQLTRTTDKSSMCTYTVNSGLGPRIENFDDLNIWKNNWFSTNQFLLEVIFHNRMKKYNCLTNDSSMAAAIFVPYYSGLDLRRYLWGFNTSMRDSPGLDLVKLLTDKPEWKRMLGKDHFLVSGRIARDFRRKSNRKSDWGSNFRILPESNNMSMLTIESGSWENDIAVPYPTYFHPSSDSEAFRWQELMRRQKRNYLFCFAGARRTRQKGSIRNEIIKQCQDSKLCNFLDCDSGGHECDDPRNLMNLFQSSIFCLQPPGDSLTRRSTFDSILAGCIPVFFHPGSAYSQYIWHLPKQYEKYSVFISPKNLRLGKVSIEQTLLSVSNVEETAMREEVIRLIPRIVYADSSSKLESVEDAFDLAIKGILKRINTFRKEIVS